MKKSDVYVIKMTDRNQQISYFVKQTTKQTISAMKIDDNDIKTFLTLSKCQKFITQLRKVEQFEPLYIEPKNMLHL